MKDRSWEHGFLLKLIMCLVFRLMNVPASHILASWPITLLTQNFLRMLVANVNLNLLAETGVIPPAPSIPSRYRDLENLLVMYLSMVIVLLLPQMIFLLHRLLSKNNPHQNFIEKGSFRYPFLFRNFAASYPTLM